MIKILVVEDEPQIADILEDTFKNIGYSTFKALNAADALDIFNKEKPDVIFLDIMLPDKSGLDVLKEMREIDSENMVFMISALKDAVTRNKAKELGAFGFVGKPFSKSQLQNLVAQNIGTIRAKSYTSTVPNILVVDDEDEIVIGIKNFISKRIKANILLAFDGEQADELIKEKDFDIIFLDITMPGKTGLEVAAENEELLKNKGTKIIMITGWTSQEYVAKASELKDIMMDFYNKPLDRGMKDKMFQKIKAFLIGRKKFIEAIN